MSKLIDARDLQNFMSRFYGYGNFRAPYWFIGIEEGGGNSVGEIALRISKWKQRGELEIEDLASYHSDIKIPQYFGNGPEPQSTWRQLIRLLLMVKGQRPTDEAIRKYQGTKLGSRAGETCLMELLPIPAPGKPYGRLMTTRSI